LSRQQIEQKSIKKRCLSQTNHITAARSLFQTQQNAKLKMP